MLLVEHLGELGEQDLDLGARLAATRAIGQTGMTRGLAQAEQRLEHLDLRPGDAIVADALEQRAAVMVAQLVVQAALAAIEVGVDRLLVPGR